MKTFDTPVVDVSKFDVVDVLTASSANDDSYTPSEPTTTEEVYIFPCA